MQKITVPLCSALLSHICSDGGIMVSELPHYYEDILTGAAALSFVLGDCGKYDRFFFLP